MRRQHALEIISLLFIVLFVYAGVSKLLDVQEFRIQISQSPLLADIALFATWFIPLSEIGIAILLTLPKFRFVAFVGCFALMAIFTTYIFFMLHSSENIPCACGGILQSLGWSEHLVFNIVFLLLSVTAIIIETNERNSHKPVNMETSN